MLDLLWINQFGLHQLQFHQVQVLAWLSSLKSIDSKDKVVDNLEEKRIGASYNSNYYNAKDLLNKERVAKKSKVGEVEIMTEKEIKSDINETKTEVKKSKDIGTERSE